MRPTLTANHIACARSGNAKLARKCRNIQRASGCPTAYFVDLILSQFDSSGITPTPDAVRSRFRPMQGTARPTALCFHVVHVVLMGAEKQMIGANTSAIVAMVEYKKPLGDVANFKFIGDARCSAVHSLKPKHAIAMKATCGPYPTIGCSIDFGPKTVMHRPSKMRLHGSAFSYVAPRAVDAVPGQFIAHIIAQLGQIPCN